MPTLGTLIVNRAKRDKKFKAQVLRSLYKQMSKKGISAENQMKILKAIKALEKL